MDLNFKNCVNSLTSHPHSCCYTSVTHFFLPVLSTGVSCPHNWKDALPVIHYLETWLLTFSDQFENLYFRHPKYICAGRHDFMPLCQIIKTEAVYFKYSHCWRWKVLTQVWKQTTNHIQTAIFKYLTVIMICSTVFGERCQPWKRKGFIFSLG